MAWPIVLQLVATYGLSVITLSFVGKIGKTELAAAALGTSFVSVLGRMVLMGLNGALDTLASQTVGAGDTGSLPTLFYRSVLFLWVHSVPLTLLLLTVPHILTWAESDAQLVQYAARYLVLLLPALWLECVARPLNSVLVAQRITRPQLLVALTVLPLHVATNWLLIHKLQWGFLGAAVATSLATVYNLTLMAVVLYATGLLPRVYGPFTARVFQGWAQYGRLAYPACLMRCAESLGFTLMTLVSSLLPDPSTAVAAASTAFNLYGILYMPFAATSLATITFVGNALGTGDPSAARTSAVASVLLSPVLWLLAGALLLEPHAQHALMLLFTDGHDPAFLHHLRLLLYIVAVLEFLDGTQTILSGVITGCGKQSHGAVVNLVAFYVLAIPVALGLGFWAHWGVEGMYMGMALGPLTQLLWYGTLVLRMDWRTEAARAQDRVRAAALR